MIFVDTGPFLARYLARDQHHVAALAHWKHLDKARLRCATSSFVLDETLTLLARRAGSAFAVARARDLYASQHLEILRPHTSDERAALEWMSRFADRRLSFTDCVSFALMRANGLRTAFTFDDHFRLAGFDVAP